MSQVPEKPLAKLKAFFERDAAQRATKPLRDGIEIALYIDDKGPVCLGRTGGRTVIAPLPPARPDMTFWTTTQGIDELSALKTEDIGEIGIAICKQMLASPAVLKAKVHIGTFDLLRNGYLGVIPLGGATLMKFLGAQGFGGIGKIKAAITKLRS